VTDPGRMSVRGEGKDALNGRLHWCSLPLGRKVSTLSSWLESKTDDVEMRSKKGEKAADHGESACQAEGGGGLLTVERLNV